MPNRNAEFKRIRKACYAPPGWWFVKADYAQEELRVLAQACSDPYMIQAFKDKLDLHLEGAKLVAPIFNEAVAAERQRLAREGLDTAHLVDYTPKDVRGFAKNNLSFLRVYGGGPGKLVEQATKGGYCMTMEQAQKLLNQMNAQSPRIEEYRQEVHQHVRKYQEIRTLFGRRRLFTGLHMFNQKEVDAALREAFNMTIQGSSADIYKRALIAVGPIIGPSFRPVNFVHDEICVLVGEGNLEPLRQLRFCMENAPNLMLGGALNPKFRWVVPLPAEITIGPNWAQTKLVDDQYADWYDEERERRRFPIPLAA